jgi:phosphomannomutase
MVKLYKNDEIIGDVEYNENLDRWDGQNYTNGGRCMHKGWGYLEEEEQFYIIIGSDWQGTQDYAYCVSAEQLIREMIDSENTRDIDKYPELQEIYDAKFNKKKATSKVFSVRVKHDETTENIEKKMNEMRAKINEYTLDFKTIKNNQ